ncbi:menaquinone biosynthetic enzyme MqnA/MqnD family protein [Pedobacter sp.]|uniref:menaquinone biosynthetic enzyme MqnA/MqnD family protein n=1 Tax=Pedobacter sp. TaxID=1411316 RepID=UPI003D7FE326
MNKIKISAVSYINTKPFIYGIEHSQILDKIDLSLDIPTDCAAKVIDGQVDMGLMPVAAFPLVPNGQLIGGYCIGSIGAVNSVFIFSKVPVEEIKSLRLDSHSRTSNHLSQVLMKFYWKQQIALTTDIDAETDAIVLIGDRTFGKKDQYAYAYDLGEEWMKFTGLPFLYAAWIANKAIPEDFIAEFNEALLFGLDHRKELLKELPEFERFDMEDYLMNKLNFELTAEKKQAMDLFLSYIERL